jgi:hypothetical protein
MAVTDGVNASTLQFVADALRTALIMPTLDLTKDGNRHKISTIDEALRTTGRPAIRNGDGTSLTIAQIATAANLTVAQVTDIAGRIGY